MIPLNFEPTTRLFQIENGFENFVHMYTVGFFKPAHQELHNEYLFAIYVYCDIEPILIS